MDIVKEADSFGCKEALFTFGEHPDETELVKSALEDLGFEICWNIFTSFAVKP